MRTGEVSTAIGTICLVLLSAILIMVACTKTQVPTQAPATTTTPVTTPAQTPTPTPAATPAAPIIIKFSLWTAPTATFSKGAEWYLTEIEKRTGGRVKFERYWSAAIAPATQTLAAITSGAAGISFVLGHYSPGKTPLSALGVVPGIVSSAWPAAMAWYELYKTVPAMEEELVKNNAKFIAPSAGSNSGYFGKKPVNSLADLKGLKLRAEGGQAELLQALGGVPVSMAITDVRDAIERGILDGYVGPVPSIGPTYKMHEIKGDLYYRHVPFGSQPYAIAMNLALWNKLPGDIQKIIQDLAPEQAKSWAQIYEVEGEAEGWGMFKQRGVNVSFPPAEEVAKFREVARGAIWDKWVKDAEAQGLPGRKVMDAYVGLVDKYTPLNPFKK